MEIYRNWDKNENHTQIQELFEEIEKSYVQGQKIKIGNFKYKNIYITVE